MRRLRFGRVAAIGLVLMASALLSSAAEPTTQGGDWVEMIGLKLSMDPADRLSVEVTAVCGLGSKEEGMLALMLLGADNKPLAGAEQMQHRPIRKGFNNVVLRHRATIPKDVQTVIVALPLYPQGTQHTEITKVKYVVIKTLDGRRVPTFQDGPAGE